MPDKERLTRLLSEYGVADRYIDDLCDEIEECFVPELEKAEKWDHHQKLLRTDDFASEFYKDDSEVPHG